MHLGHLRALSTMATALALLTVPGTAALAAPPANKHASTSCGGPCSQDNPTPMRLALVFKDDDRRVLDEDERRRFNAVGLIVSSSGAMGSGAVVVQRDIVVTSAHLFFEEGKLLHPLETYSFAIGGGSGDWTRKKDYRIAEIHVGTKFVDAHVSKDWAVVRLAEQVDEAIQPLQLRAFENEDTGKEVLNIAFHGDLSSGGVPHVTTCRFQRPEKGAPEQNDAYDSPNIFIHDCDIIGGASGGPFVITEDGQDYLVAINQGFFQAYVLPSQLQNVFLPGVMFNVAVGADRALIEGVNELSRRRGSVSPATAVGPGQASGVRNPKSAGPISVAERLRTLSELHAKGLVTKEEAARKRREILDDL